MVLDEYKDNKLSAVVLQKHYRLASYSSLTLFRFFQIISSYATISNLVSFRSVRVHTEIHTCE